jgi:hypothetical protein
MMNPNERWLELTQHPLWKELFEGEQSVVAQERRMLEDRVRDVRVTDPVECMRFKAFLHGIDYVRIKAEQMSTAAPEKPQPLPAPPRSMWFQGKLGG